MAKSRWEYVKKFELSDSLLPETYVIVRIDGKGFHRFADIHKFHKPNDLNALGLMNHAAKVVVESFKDIVLAYGESDEYSFMLGRSCNLYNRRNAKIVSTMVSTFTAAYIFNWNKYMSTPLPTTLPVFDGRAITYPTLAIVKDYFRWRQADCHVNNLYNTIFHGLIKSQGMSENQAHEKLKGSLSKDKHEMLYSLCNIKYGDEPEICKKGSVIIVNEETSPGDVLSDVEAEIQNDERSRQGRGTHAGIVDSNTNERSTTDSGGKIQTIAEDSHRIRGKSHIKKHRKIELQHIDIIQDAFWENRLFS